MNFFVKSRPDYNIISSLHVKKKLRNFAPLILNQNETNKVSSNGISLVGRILQ